ncbi:metallophosphoesterase [Noviherbaspirillum aridicola]|uniref:Calcineurin-like phosphoesterase family protein n=1 Tax=Noviherbaspirillum aridicola TaxID=2849687 RepID=A0ABQ4Q915_9BURK|nr:metallophosphoesterase [Noviherbaspirillum aridicola]GIZ53701.1 hypothetical protein NCCP691_37150 [Noviherbaspirillum aridicola]
MTAVILHLSDIHVRTRTDWILDKSEAVASCVYSALPDASVVFIVISGDIAWSGKSDEYKIAKAFLEKVRDAIQSERPIPVHFVTAPGNHDCDFDLNTKTRTLTLRSVRAAPSEIDESVIDTGCLVQLPYRAFAEDLCTPDETRVGDQLWTSHRFTVEGKELIFDTLNVSWCSQIREEPGSLVFPLERYARQSEDYSDLRVVVLHHPLNWFSQSIYHPFRRLVRTIANVVISGHEHVGGVGEDFHAESGHSAYIEGCVLQDDKRPNNSSFNVAELSLLDGTYRSTRYAWDPSHGFYRSTEEGSWSDFRSLPRKSVARFQVTEPFEQLITDAGAAFQTLKGSSIKLQDLYVFPDMQEPLDKAEVKRILSTSILRDLSRLENGVLISGEEKVGATSLLYILFAHFHEQGLLPVYVRGADIRSATERDVDAAIRKAAIEQYGELQLEKFFQTSSAKKVLLLDDLDDGPVKAGTHRARLLETIAARFQYFVVTVSELFDYKSTVAPHTSESMSALKEYNLLQFGYTLRAQLVRRWFQRTSDDGSLDEANLLAICDRAERLLDAVMARNIVPALPLYLLTLLQSMDAGVSGGLEESGLGEYYDFLIKEGLRAAEVPKKDWGKVIEYCSHLAWQMHATEHKELSKEEMRLFTDRYSKEEHRVDLDHRLNQLVRARVLSRSGDYIRFRYHYIYYFLKGRFLSAKLDDLAVQAHIKECCAHLYVRENANTILFLAHHAFDNSVFLSCVVEAVNAPFRDSTPIRFVGTDTEAVVEFVRDLPALKYTGEEPEKVRERANRHKDELDNDFDGMSETKRENAETDFIAQMVSLFKTVEILGQILKNQIANVGRQKRVELLQLLMNGPLRAIRAYFDLFMQDKEQAQRELADIIARNKLVDGAEQCQEAARRFMAQMAQFTAFGFIAKAVSSVSSDDLLEDIDSAAKTIDSPAARLIATGVRLDSPRDLPRPEMRRLLDDIDTDFIATRVLQMLTLRRLYMFRTSERDKQWLDSQGILGIRMQHAVDYGTNRRKQLKRA